MRFILFLSLLILGVKSVAETAEDGAEIMKVEYVGAYSQDVYLNGLLDKALEYTIDEYGPYEISTHPPASDWREVKIISYEPKKLRIAVTSKPHQIRDKTHLRMLYVPLIRGAFGFRVCVSSAGFADELTAAFNSGDLSAIRFGAGHEWSDVDILRHNGLRVSETGFDQNVPKAIDSLYKMTAFGRIDAFCRGVNEVLREQPFYEDSTKLVLNQSHVIVYDMPFFFYMHPDNTKLYDRLALGFRKMLASGEWAKHWEEHMGESLKFTNLENRKVIHLKSIDSFFDNETYRSYLFF